MKFKPDPREVNHRNLITPPRNASDKHNLNFEFFERLKLTQFLIQNYG